MEKEEKKGRKSPERKEKLWINQHVEQKDSGPAKGGDRGGEITTGKG